MLRLQERGVGMSTLKTTNVSHPSAVDPAIVLDAAGGVVDVNGVPWGNKILQVVRATDSTNRSTSSQSFVDANLSITITPTKVTSNVIVITSVFVSPTGNSTTELQITDSSNVAISGAERAIIGNDTLILKNMGTVIGFVSPATLSATTYKLRFKMSSGTGIRLENAINTAQIYAIEVSA